MSYNTKLEDELREPEEGLDRTARLGEEVERELRALIEQQAQGLFQQLSERTGLLSTELERSKQELSTLNLSVARLEQDATESRRSIELCSTRVAALDEARSHHQEALRDFEVRVAAEVQRLELLERKMPEELQAARTALQGLIEASERRGQDALQRLRTEGEQQAIKERGARQALEARAAHVTRRERLLWWSVALLALAQVATIILALR